ncbi:hypothetical protein J6590_102231 [Homalodisca vitripennis]|nr:hypothetical protein J6590_102231 [Homalodisca vitripennis]
MACRWPVDERRLKTTYCISSMTFWWGFKARSLTLASDSQKTFRCCRFWNPMRMEKLVGCWEASSNPGGHRRGGRPSAVYWVEAQVETQPAALVEIRVYVVSYLMPPVGD